MTEQTPEIPIFIHTLPERYATIHEVVKLSSKVSSDRLIEKFGPFVNKAGSELRVSYAWSLNDIPESGAVFFRYDKEELKKIGVDIRGLREYRIIPKDEGRKGMIAGYEFHRVRTEIVGVTQGEATFYLEDLAGNGTEVTLRQGEGILIPPFIWHVYVVNEPKTEVLAIANTLYDPKDPRTYDTYLQEAFESLQKENLSCFLLGACK